MKEMLKTWVPSLGAVFGSVYVYPFFKVYKKRVTTAIFSMTLPPHLMNTTFAKAWVATVVIE
jgi:hypothetical protein